MMSNTIVANRLLAAEAYQQPRLLINLPPIFRQLAAWLPQGVQPYLEVVSVVEAWSVSLTRPPGLPQQG